MEEHISSLMKTINKISQPGSNITKCLVSQCEAVLLAVTEVALKWQLAMPEDLFVLKDHLKNQSKDLFRRGELAL